ncbi:MAG: n-acetylglutamate synthase [Fluviicola sp. XM-24bin1]|nr:MAG: n-acetylglutamate synthase [Fluviicola sp. XM-24bin1]
MMNYDNKKFKVIETSGSGEISDDFIFDYQQEGDVLSCSYSGGDIQEGMLVGSVDDDGIITFTYRQVNSRGMERSGICVSTPEVMENGKIRLHEQWRWTDGDQSTGTTTLEEILS